MKAKIAADQAAKKEEEDRIARIQKEADDEFARQEAEAKALADAAQAGVDEKKRAKLEEKAKMQADGTWLSKK